MTKIIAISQRVDYFPQRQEKRDGIDRKWLSLLKLCGYDVLLIPNEPEQTQRLVERIGLDGILLTGGNSLVKYGGDAPMRDETEVILVEYALANNIPILGVCRGMQIIQDYWQTSLEKVKGHVQAKQVINYDQQRVSVNSYHEFASFLDTDGFHTFAKADDGVVKGIKHQSLPVTAIMWHPERCAPFCEQDIQLIKALYKS